MREGLRETPRRHISFLAEFLAAPEVSYTTFAGEGYDEMIIQSDITFYSICEHHLVPFFGTGTIAYIPDKRIVGLSKLARTLERYSRQLQNQERITMQVADELERVLRPRGVAVMLTARHLCMEMRGVRKPGTTTTTSRLTGAFKSRPETRNEFLQLARGSRHD
jgi:GTP cyclohydrolase I